MESLAINADGERLATGCRDGTVRVVELSSSKVLVEYKMPSNVCCVAYGPWIAVGMHDGRFEVFEDILDADNEAGMRRPDERQIVYSSYHESPIYRCCFDKAGLFLATVGNSHTLRVVDTRSWAVIFERAAKDTLYSVCFDPSGRCARLQACVGHASTFSVSMIRDTRRCRRPQRRGDDIRSRHWREQRDQALRLGVGR